MSLLENYSNLEEVCLSLIGDNVSLLRICKKIMWNVRSCLCLWGVYVSLQEVYLSLIWV